MKGELYGRFSVQWKRRGSGGQYIIYELFCFSKEADIAVTIKVAKMRRLCYVFVRMGEVAILNESCVLNPEATDEHSNQTNVLVSETGKRESVTEQTVDSWQN